MYIQRIPHPLTRYRGRSSPPLTPLQSSAGQTSPAPLLHPTGYVVLAVVLAILLLSAVGYLVARSFPRMKLGKNKSRANEGTGGMRERGRQPAMFSSLINESDASFEPPSPSSSEGPLTPTTFEQEPGKECDPNVRSKAVESDSYITGSMPVYIQSPTQIHSLRLSSPAIRPHGLPLWPVPEESSGIPSLPSVYDDNELFYRPPST